MNNEIKQTAVEWLVEEIRERMITIYREPNSPTREVMILNLDMNLEKFKEMEKEQKKLMFDCGRQYQLTGEGTFTEVYNETYGGNKLWKIKLNT